MGKPSKEMEVLIKKMCEFAKINYYDIDFDDTFWYHKHTWTFEQQNQFRNWFINEIKNNNVFRKKYTTLPYRPYVYMVKKVVDNFIFKHGFRLKYI